MSLHLQGLRWGSQHQSPSEAQRERITVYVYIKKHLSLDSTKDLTSQSKLPITLKRLFITSYSLFSDKNLAVVLYWQYICQKQKEKYFTIMLGSDYMKSAWFWYDPFDVGCRD